MLSLEYDDPDVLFYLGDADCCRIRKVLSLANSYSCTYFLSHTSKVLKKKGQQYKSQIYKKWRIKNEKGMLLMSPSWTYFFKNLRTGGAGSLNWNSADYCIAHIISALSSCPSSDPFWTTVHLGEKVQHCHAGQALILTPGTGFSKEEQKRFAPCLNPSSLAVLFFYGSVYQLFTQPTTCVLRLVYGWMLWINAKEYYDWPASPLWNKQKKCILRCLRAWITLLGL